MLFSSISFLYYFLPLVLFVYFLVPRRAKNFVLLLASLVFYFYGEPVYTLLLLASTLSAYLHGLLIDRTRGTRACRAFLWSSVMTSVALLGFFKYSDFFIQNVNTLLSTRIPLLRLALPIGISFYTFQTISYVIDVYRGQAKAQKSYWKFFMYVSLYPQLVAGPIVRYTDVAAEIEERSANKEDFAAGIARFCIGLSKKVLIANIAGDFASRYLDGDLSGLTTAGAWFGILMYAIQIYFDFSGYSDMAIGLARLFGFHYVENFNYPYISRSATEFWRRWHISMGSFFRDYVYIPMGGNRRHQFVNLFVVWFLTGLWHGASWNFVLWGLWFFVFLMIERLFLKKFLEKVPVLSNIYLLVVVLLGWVIFRFTNLELGMTLVKSLFGLNGNPLTGFVVDIEFDSHIYLLILSVLVSTPLARILRFQTERRICTNRAAYAVWQVVLYSIIPVVLLLLSTASLVGDSYNPFIYFQF